MKSEFGSGIDGQIKLNTMKMLICNKRFKGTTSMNIHKHVRFSKIDFGEMMWDWEEKRL